MQTNIIYNQDCFEILPTLPDGSIDLIATDPPYHLSNVEPLENRLKKVIRTFNNIIFPQFNDGNIKVFKYSELVRILRSSFNLTWSKNSSVGVKSWVGVPKSPVDFNRNIEIRQVEIDTTNEPARLITSNDKLMDKVTNEKGEFIGDFILDFGDTVDFPTSDISGCNLGKFIDGVYTMSISAIESPSCPCLQSPESSIFGTNDFMEDIRLSNYSFGKPDATPSILASWRTENGFMLRFDLRGRTAKLLSASTTDQTNLQGLSFSPKLIRTFAGASCLSAIFKPITVSLILNTTDGAKPFYFYLFVPFKEIIPQLYREVKGFMGKSWDAMPSTEIWRECLRVLKPGAFAFVMSIPRQDCLSRMIISLEDAGFNVSYSPIYHCFASGFPKAQNIGKAVDKRLGVEREIVGANPNDRRVRENPLSDYGLQGGVGEGYITIPATPQAKALDGSYGGFQPKPAVEVIIVAMKPLSEKTYVDQALANRHGITWLDDGRIPYQGGEEEADVGGNFSKAGKEYEGKMYEGSYLESKTKQTHAIPHGKGRFPANLLVSDDVLNDGKVTKSEGGKTKRDTAFFDKAVFHMQGYGDSGSFSRYFDLDKWWEERIKQLPNSVQKTFPYLIIPKASKGEKNRGLDFEPVPIKGRDEGQDVRNVPYKARSTPRVNQHPTVKPLKLMSYLITLGSREGDIVLDPFIGTGTTVIAAQMLGRNFIGIEISAPYYDIARARLNSARQLRLNEKST